MLPRAALTLALFSAQGSAAVFWISMCQMSTVLVADSSSQISALNFTRARLLLVMTETNDLDSMGFCTDASWSCVGALFAAQSDSPPPLREKFKQPIWEACNDPRR